MFHLPRYDGCPYCMDKTQDKNNRIYPNLMGSFFVDIFQTHCFQKIGFFQAKPN